MPPPKDKDSILVFLILLNSISLIIESTNSGIKLSTLENLLKSQYGQITSQKEYEYKLITIYGVHNPDCLSCSPSF